MTKTDRRILTNGVVLDIYDEMERAENLFGPFHSLHEAIAVIREEYLELEQAIFWGNKNGDNTATVRLEALHLSGQVSATGGTVKSHHLVGQPVKIRLF